MKIAIATENGNIAEHLGACKSFTIVTVSDDGKTFEKTLLPCTGEGHVAVVSLLAEAQVDALICGTLGLMARSALQMIDIALVPGCTGDIDAAMTKYLAGEPQGDPSILTTEIKMDENDPMQCMHDCSKCGGCGSEKIPDEVKKRIPEV